VEGAKRHAGSLLLPLLQVLASEKDKRVVMRLQQAVFLQVLQQVQGSQELQALKSLLPTVARCLLTCCESKTPSFNQVLFYRDGKLLKAGIRV